MQSVSGAAYAAGQILVVNHGEIIDHGNHEELLTQEGFYARLHRGQFAGDEELARQEEAQIREQQLAIATGGPGNASRP